MRCGVTCPFWHFNPSFKCPSEMRLMCLKWHMPLFRARDKCFTVTGPGKARKRSGVKGVKPIEAKAWTGSLRGWGPITVDLPDKVNRKEANHG